MHESRSGMAPAAAAVGTKGEQKEERDDMVNALRA